MKKYDHVVIGAGIVGSCTAWHLARKGRNVLLLEQFTLPHTRGSSHGQTRMTRSCYAEECFAKIMPHSLAIWKELEELSGKELIARTGVVCFSTPEEMADIRKSMSTYNPTRHHDLNDQDVRSLVPYMKGCPKNRQALMDKTGGVILANTTVATVQNLFKGIGGRILDGTPVEWVDIRDAEKVTVATANEIFTASSIVVCAGAWTPKVFLKKNPELAERLQKYMQGTAVDVYYWKYLSEVTRDIPCFIDSSKDFCIYGLSPVEYPGLIKVTFHGGTSCDPNERERAIPDLKNEAFLKQYVVENLPGLDPDPAIIEKCMYTTTTDECYIVDYLFEHRNVILGCGFSGMGFKTSPVIGKMLSEMATGETCSHDVPEFKLSRFTI